MCGQQPCKVKGYKQCAVCGQIKLRKCTRRECVQARQPLLLTYNGAAEDDRDGAAPPGGDAEASDAAAESDDA